MYAPLWDKIWDFKLDKPEEEYGFSTRLAYENAWTLNFTQSAILEYKKFMFLAATGSEMVSPSEIVDIVWHQHLIFTESYRELCELLGKTIAHIPSTHNHAEKEKFAKAKERTKILYESYFGKQVDEIWNYHSPLDSLKLKKFPFSITQINVGLFLCFVVWLPLSYSLFKPLLTKIDGIDFIILYTAFFALLFVMLELFISGRFSTILNKLTPNQIIGNLNPFELIYMKTAKLTHFIHAVVNNLMESGKIEVIKDNKIALVNDNLSENPFENCIIQTLKTTGNIHYTALLKQLISKPIFLQVYKSTSYIKEKFNNSINFLIQYCFLSIAFLFLFSIGLSRLFLGLTREKPVGYLVITLIVCFIMYLLFMQRNNSYFIKISIPNLYS